MLSPSKLKLFLPLAPLILFAPTLFSHHWIPQHDTLGSVLWLQYFMGQIHDSWAAPLWNPYTAWGHTAQLPWITSMSPSLCLLALIAKVFPGLNAVSLFYVSCVIDELILAAGVYALASQVFKDRAVRLLVCFSIVGTVFWSSQVYWNFRSYYCLPLAFYFFLTGIRQERMQKLILGFLILVSSAVLGNIVYILFLHLMLAGVFIGAICYAEQKKLPWPTKLTGLDGLLLCGVIAALVLTFTFIKWVGTPTLLAVERDANGMVGYRTFLNHVVYADLRYFTGILDGLSNHFDVTVYGGLLMLPFAVYGVLFHWSRRIVPFLAVTLFLFLFWAGEKSFVAPLAYVIPGAGMYRYVGLVTPLIKIGLVFLAGFGFEKLLTFLEGDLARKRLFALAGAFALFLVAFGIFGWKLQHEYRAEPRTLLVAVLYFAYAAWFLGILWHRSVMPELGRPLLVIIVLVDVMSYRLSLYNERMFSVSDFTWQQLESQTLPYAVQRTENLEASSVLRKLVEDTGGKLGANHNIYDTFFKIDRCFSPWVMDSAQPAVAELMNRYDLKPQTIVDFNRPGMAPLKELIGCEQSKLKFIGSEKSTTQLSLQSFSGTRLTVDLVPPPSRYQTLAYADAWHPFWRVYLDGKRVAVHKMVAFKMLSIPPNTKRVEFRFFDPVATVLFYSMWIWGLGAALLLTGWSVGHLLGYEGPWLSKLRQLVYYHS